MSGSPSSGSSTVTNSNPMAEAQIPYLKTGWSGAQDVYNQGMPPYYPGSTVAGLNPEQMQALQFQAQRATEGSPLNQAASGTLLDTIQGKYLGADNPYFQQMSDSIWNQIQPRLSAQFGNQYGGTLHQGATASAMAQALAPIAYQNYASERGMQQQALGMAPMLANQDYIDASQLFNAGAQMQGQNQALINEQIARYGADSNNNYNNVARYLSLIGSPIPGLGTQTQTYQQPSSNPMMGILGLGMSGLGMAGQFGWL